MAETTPDAMTRAQRLDRLPFTKRHARLLAGSGVGWALDAMDVGLISFIMVALAAEWGLNKPTVGWIVSIGFIGMAVGASVGGWLADRIGRRQVFAWTMVLYGLATLASAFVPSGEGSDLTRFVIAPGMFLFLLLRFLVGAGLGAELPVASTLVSEYAPKAIRGRVVVGLEAFWAVGWIMAALLGFLVVPNFTDGWRWALAIGIVPALYALVVRFGLPESVRFLESKDRDAEAEEAVRVFEESAGVEPPATTIEWTPASQSADSLWSTEYRGRTLALWLVWFGVNFSYYGAFLWIPTLLVDRGFDITKSFMFTLIITLAQLPGYAAAAWLIEKWGRRLTLAVFLTGSAVSAALYGLAASESAIIAAGCALSFFNLGAWGALYAIGPEIYPTSLRSTGSGAAAAFGRIASIIAPLLVPVFLGWGGESGALVTFAIFAAGFLLAAVAAWALPERTDVALER